MANENRRLIDANDLWQKTFICDEVAEVRKFIENAPTVDAVEVVHARWHDVYLLSPWVATGVCGHCKLTSYINPDFPHAKHCPNCGAKMDGGNEDG